MKENIARAKKLYGTFRFISDPWTLTDEGEFQESYREIYPYEVVPKLELSGSHATSLI